MNTVPTAEAQPEGGERVIVNPVSGERIVIRTSGAETDGRLLVFDLFLPPGAHVPGGHVHPNQTEQFTVLVGRIRFVLGSQTVLAAPDDTVLVSAGTPHWFGNVGPDTAHIEVEVRPALRMEELLAASATLAVGGHFFGTRLPRLSDLAHLLFEFQHELAVPHLPPAVARVIFGCLARLGQRQVRRGTT